MISNISQAACSFGHVMKDMSKNKCRVVDLVVAVSMLILCISPLFLLCSGPQGVLSVHQWVAFSGLAITGIVGAIRTVVLIESIFKLTVDHYKASKNLVDTNDAGGDVRQYNDTDEYKS